MLSKRSPKGNIRVFYGWAVEQNNKSRGSQACLKLPHLSNIKHHKCAEGAVSSLVQDKADPRALWRTLGTTCAHIGKDIRLVFKLGCWRSAQRLLFVKLVSHSELHLGTRRDDVVSASALHEHAMAMLRNHSVAPGRLRFRVSSDNSLVDRLV